MSKQWAALRVEKICNERGETYLKRYRLIETPWFRIYLHRIYLSDNDRDFHDHPWSFVSFILQGGYIEHTPEGTHHFKSGAMITHAPEDLHWLEVPPGKTATTLVFTGPRKRTWGFQTLKGWIPYFSYKDVGHRC